MWKRLPILLLVLVLFLQISPAASAYPAPTYGAQDAIGKFEQEIPLSFTHRAAWRMAPENSLPAIYHSIAMGIDGIEIDVMLSKDGVLTLFHDTTIDRTVVGSTGSVADYNWSALKSMALRAEQGGSSFTSAYTLTAEQAKILNSLPNYKAHYGANAASGGKAYPARFDDCLDMVKMYGPKTFITIDKCSSQEVFVACYKLLREKNMLNNAFFKISQNASTINTWATAAANVWNTAYPNDTITQSDVKNTMMHMHVMGKPNAATLQTHLKNGTYLKAVEVTYGADTCAECEAIITESFDAFCDQNNIALYGSTISTGGWSGGRPDSEKTWAYMLGIGFDGIMTDRASELSAYLNDYNRQRVSNGTIQAEHFQYMNSVGANFSLALAANSSMNKVVNNLRNGEWLEYRNVRFSGKENQLKIGAQGLLKGAKLNFYIDSISSGNLIGTYTLAADSAVGAETINLSKFVSAGEHKLFVQASGTASTNLANLDYFTFVCNSDYLVSVPAYSGGTSSGWMTYDCGQYLGLANTGTESKMRIVTDTTASQFLAYGTALKEKGYTVLYEKKIAAQTEYNRHYKFLAPDGSHAIYTYFVDAYKETRIIVDTNTDSFRRISYTGSGNNTGRTELYMVPFSAAQDGYGYSSDYGSQNRNNAGSMFVIKFADNSLFVVDGGSYIQMSDRDCERVYAFLRRITGIPEGQKITINTWFITHYHDDHVSGFPRFLYKYYTQFDLQNVMYNFDVVGASGDNMEIIGKLYPNAKYYKQHTGEYFTICDVRFDVLYTVEDLYTPNSSNQLITRDVGCMRKSDEENNCSSVLRVTFDGKTALLTGDIYDADRILIDMYPQADLHADILQIPHHAFDGHVTLVKTVAPSISFLNQVERATTNRKDLYTNNHNWMPYAGTIYYGNSDLVGYCAENGIFLQEPFTEAVDWLSWGNLTRDMTEANYYESGTVADPEQYYRYDRVTTAPGKINGTYMIVDNKMGYPLYYSTVNGTVANGSMALYSNDRYYFGASQRRYVNWNMSFNATTDSSLAIVSGGKGYYVSGSVQKGSGDYWGTNTKNAYMALGKGDTYTASGMFGKWASFTNQMEADTNSVRLDMLQDNTFLLYARYNSNGSTYHPLYRDAYMATTDQGWGASSLSKDEVNAKLDYPALRLYSYNTTPDTLLLSWTGHKDYYTNPGISKSQALSLLTADLRVKYQFQNSGDSGEIYYDGWQKNAMGTYWLEFPSNFSGSKPGNYTITIKFKSHGGSEVTVGNFALHIQDRSNDLATQSLFFDFNDDAASRKNYQYETQYNGINFDATSRWEFIEYNASTKTNDTAFGFVDTLSGTLKLYTKTLDTARKNLSVRTYAGGTNPLSYSPKNAEVVQIRFKAENLKAAIGETANFRLCYFKDGGTELFYDTIYTLGADYVADGKYVVVTVPTSQAFRDSTTITGIRPAFSYVIPADTSKEGSVTIDYLYIGPASGAPAQENRSLFFDFTNTAEDRERYTAEAYNGLNFDREAQPNWGTSETSTSAKIYNDCTVSNAEGVLKVNVAEDLAYGTTNSYYGPWVVTSAPAGYIVGGGNREYHALGFEPQAGDCIRLRFKLEGCVSATETDPQIVVVYDRTIDGVSNRGSYNMTASYTLENDVYQTITIPVTEEFATSDVITNLGFRFWHIKAETKGSGKVIIDYIYVGSPEDAPAASHTVTFTHADGTVLYRQDVAQGGTASYAGETPTKASDANNHYTFAGWDKDLTNITSHITVTATYTATAHTWTYAEVDATNHKNTCSCGYSKSEAHTWDRGVITTDPTCTTAGIMTYTCRDCKGTKTEGIEANGHTEVTDKAIAATCTTAGKTEGKHCSVCNAVLTAQTTIPAKGHTEVTVKGTAATCTKTGLTDGKKCSVCGTVTIAQQTIEALGHSEVIDKAVAATCTTAGKTEGKHCSVCNTVLTAQTTIPAKGHTEVTIKGTSATCTKTGLTDGKKCSVCETVTIAQQTIEALGHSEVTDKAIAATCTTAGKTEGKHCSVCGEVLVAQEVVPATGHVNTSVETTNATCTEDGLVVISCDCGELISTEIVAALGHCYDIENTLPTCTENGLSKLVCTRCCETLYTEIIPALGHSFEYINEGDAHRVVCRNRCDATDEHGTSCDNGCDYAVTEAHSYVDGICVCGAVEITEPILDSSLTFGAQLYLENDLTMAFRVKTDKLNAYDISTACLVVERDVYESDAAQATVETMTISEYKIEGGRLIFSYPGIAAAQMNDAIRATFHIKNAKGQEYVSPVVNTSVATYLDGLLSASASDSKMVTLIMDMLNYGAAAQVYFDRHADAPVNEAYESFKTYASYASADFTKVLENLATTENAEGKSGKLNLGLDLGTRIGIQYKVTVPSDVNVEDVTLVVTDASGKVLETLAVAGNATDSRGRYLVNFYGSTSRDMRRVVYATAYAKGEAITGTYAYSISTYAWGVQENASLQPENLVTVTRAMLLYGDSAAAYFA